MRGNHFLLGLLLGTFAVGLFAASLPATRVAVLALDPYFVTAARATLAGLVAVTVLTVLRRPFPRRDLKRLLAIALCLVIGFPGLMALAMTTLPSAHAGVTLGLLPIATAVAAVFVAHERPSPLFWAMSVLGAGLVVAFSLRGGAIVPEAGDLILFAGIAICGLGYALSATLSRRMPGWEVISWAVVLSLPVFLPLTLYLWPRETATVPWQSWAGVVYIALVAQYLAYWLWNSALALGGVARIGQLQLLQPFATFGIAALFLGEAIDLRMVGFATAVVVVVALGLRTRVGAKAAAAPSASVVVEAGGR